MSKKKKRPEYVKEMCQRVIDRIDEELLKPEPYISDKDRKRRNYEVPREILKDARKEIAIMMKVLDKEKYMPSYTHFLIDSYSPITELGKLLLKIELIYEKNT